MELNSKVKSGDGNDSSFSLGLLVGRLFFFYLVNYERTTRTSTTPREETQHKSYRLRQILEDFSLKQTVPYPDLLITPCKDLIIALPCCYPVAGTDILDVSSIKTDSLPGNHSTNWVTFLLLVNSSSSLQSTFFWEQLWPSIKPSYRSFIASTALEQIKCPFFNIFAKSIF